MQVTWESVSVLQVTRSRVQVNVRIPIRYCKSAHWVWMCNEIKGSYDEIIITIVPNYTEKLLFVCCHWHCYSCCTLVTIQMATNSWYFPIYIALVILVSHCWYWYSQKFSPTKVSHYMVSLNYWSSHHTYCNFHCHLLTVQWPLSNTGTYIILFTMCISIYSNFTAWNLSRSQYMRDDMVWCPPSSDTCPPFFMQDGNFGNFSEHVCYRHVQMCILLCELALLQNRA